MAVLLDVVRRGFAPPAFGEGPGDVRVRVLGGYAPDTIRVPAGVPFRLVFRREETAVCSEQVVFPALGKSAMLPFGEDVSVELVVEEPGEYEFTCGMGMLRGRLVVTGTGCAGGGGER